MLRRICALMIAVLWLTGCRSAIYAPGAEGIGDPYYPQLGNGGYDAAHYTLELSVDPKNNSLSGVCTLEAQATQPLSAFNLDFDGLSIDQVTVDGGEAAYQRKDRELTITPSRPIRQGEDFTVMVAYHGTPEASTSLGAWFPKGWFRNQQGEILATNEINGAARWYPVNDHPLDKAAYRLQITVPKPYVAAAIGLQKEELDQGDSTTYIWESAEPTASYLVGLNVAEYVLETVQGPDGVQIRNYLPPGFPEAYRKSLDQLDEMLAFFSERFGPYPFKAYGVVIVNSPDANFIAMETQALSQHTLTLTALSETILAHELAHQWFGDSVSLEAWKDLWLKEGAATYASWMWKEHREGAEALEKHVRGIYPTQAWASDPPGNPSPTNLYTLTIYDRGALTFHALRLRLGDEVFFRLLRAYTEKYRYGNAGTDDFIALAEEVSGQELDEFFQGWLYDKKIPAIPEMGLKP